MREFVVILRSGVRYTVKADRVVTDAPYVFLMLSPAPAIGAPDFHDAVAVFDQREVLAVLSREHLVAEEQGEPIAGPHVVDEVDHSNIPF